MMHGITTWTDIIEDWQRVDSLSGGVSGGG